MVLRHQQQLGENGYIARRRSRQSLEWMKELIDLGLEDAFRRNPAVAGRWGELEAAVNEGRVTALAASRELLGLFQFSEQGARKG